MVTLFRPRQLFIGAAALLVLAGCGAAEPTLDDRVDDLEAAIELYRTVDGAKCDDPAIGEEDAEGVGALCEDEALISWRPDEADAATQAEVAGFEGIPRIVGVNVFIERPGLGCEAVQEQIGGVCAS